MAVAYQTGVASSPSDLLAKMISFIALNGWTYVVPSTGDAAISNGESSGQAIACGIDVVTANQWQTRGCEQINAAVGWNAQPGRANQTHTCNWGTGPFTAYHLWVGDEDGFEYVHLSVEVTSGEFRHWALGQMVPFGTIVGGVYSDSTFLATNDSLKNAPEYSGHRHLCDAGCNDQGAHVLLDYDGKVGGHWQAVTQAGSVDANFHTGSNRSLGIIAPFMTIGYQRWNLRTPMWPMIYFANRASSLRSPIGRMPHIRSINIRNFFPGQTYTIGSEDWMVLPVFQKQIDSVGSGIVSSGLYGYAHLMP